MVSSSVHTAVMVREALEFLDLKAGCYIIDCTVGAGGHSKKILEKIIPGGKLIGLDQDPEILEIAAKELAEFKEHVILTKENFRNLDLVLKDLKIDKVDGVIFDLGVSSLQLESSLRGFSFNQDGPLDMRMSDTGKSAAELVNFLGKDELADIIYKFGEERYSRRIAEAIAQERRRKPINTTAQLKNIVMSAMPKARSWQKIHPATRTFQALRIAVNDELGALEEALDKGVEALKPGGRICVISFHSLEDRIVKNTFRELAKGSMLEIRTKKPVIPQDSEIKNNPRARSAKLRAAIKI